MPFAALPAIIGAVTAGLGATELGLNLAGVGQPSPGDAAKQAQAAQEKQAAADAETRRKMILAALPGAQEQSGGALNAPSLTDLASVIAGLPGESNTGGAGEKALSSYLGLPGTGASTSLAPKGSGNLVETLFGLGSGGGASGGGTGLSGSQG
jgi:hypothetical protein